MGGFCKVEKFFFSSNWIFRCFCNFFSLLGGDAVADFVFNTALPFAMYTVKCK